ncbi:MAG: hypothetical protein J6W88_05575 [Bacteroidales bacterium]|nr:hypothetical protein [Bacteroidales bacterium]
MSNPIATRPIIFSAFFSSVSAFFMLFLLTRACFFYCHILSYLDYIYCHLPKKNSDATSGLPYPQYVIIISSLLLRSISEEAAKK